MSNPKVALLLDTETDGLDPEIHRCIEVAVTLFDLVAGVPISSYASLLWADSNDAEPVNRIPVSALLESPDPAEVWPLVRLAAERADVIVAHRAEFDQGFVPPELAAIRPWVCSKFHIAWPCGKHGDGLVSLALAHGIGVVSAHRALTDVDMLTRLFQRVHSMGVDLSAMVGLAMRPRTKLQALVKYDDREKAKAAGFSWDGTRRVWWKEVFLDDCTPFDFQVRPLDEAT